MCCEFRAFGGESRAFCGELGRDSGPRSVLRPFVQCIFGQLDCIGSVQGGFWAEEVNLGPFFCESPVLERDFRDGERPASDLKAEMEPSIPSIGLVGGHKHHKTFLEANATRKMNKGTPINDSSSGLEGHHLTSKAEVWP